MKLKIGKFLPVLFLFSTLFIFNANAFETLNIRGISCPLGWECGPPFVFDPDNPSVGFLSPASVHQRCTPAIADNDINWDDNGIAFGNKCNATIRAGKNINITDASFGFDTRFTSSALTIVIEAGESITGNISCFNGGFVSPLDNKVIIRAPIVNISKPTNCAGATIIIAPFAKDDFYSSVDFPLIGGKMVIGDPLDEILKDGVLKNDTSNPTTDKAEIVNKGAKGFADLKIDGSFTYTPNADFTSGEDSFTYKVTNEAGESNEASVTIIIEKPVCETIIQNGFTSESFITDGASISGTFSTVNSNITMEEAANICEVDHFNWIQYIISDDGVENCLSAENGCDELRDRGEKLPVPIYIDPPKGGYKYQADDHNGGNFSVQDNYPMYLDEEFTTLSCLAFALDNKTCILYSSALRVIESPGEAKSNREDYTDEFNLNFYDSPQDGLALVTIFRTCIVGVKDNAPILLSSTQLPLDNTCFQWTHTGGGENSEGRTQIRHTNRSIETTGESTFDGFLSPDDLSPEELNFLEKLFAEGLPIEILIKKAQVKVKRNKLDKDKFKIEGAIILGSESDGIDPLSEEVVVTFDGYSETIPAGTFIRKDRRGKFIYKGSKGTGIKKFEIKDDGDFRVEGKLLDFSGVDFNEPVPFALGIGDDLGDTSIQFDDKLKFED